MQYTFGAGNLTAVKAGVAVPTPHTFAVLQEVSVDFSFNLKELMGNLSFPVAVGRGAGKIQAKAKFAAFKATALNDLFFDGSVATGEARVAVSEPGTPTTNSLTVANSATFLEDQGVFNRNSGRFMERVASAPAAGQYTVAAGVYTFAAADSNPPVYVTYRHSVSGGSGRVITINNNLMGIQPTFSATMATSFTHGDGVTRQLALKLNACVASKFSFATKQEDFVVPDFDFGAFADAAGVVGTLSLAE
jgi:hypothetical protein